MLDLTDYELMWPTGIFVAEARRILSRPQPNRSHLDLLLKEAFRDHNVADDLERREGPSGYGAAASARRWPDMAHELIDRADEIRQFTAPRPYWVERHQGESLVPVLDSSAARRGFADFVGELERTGYLAQLFPDKCVDSDEPESDISLELEKRLGVAGLWPLQPQTWNDDIFYGLIEVYHDLVSRPRHRWLHDFSNCGWHYQDFTTTAGREIYRWRVNSLLESAGVNYRIAAQGEDTGRLVEVFDDARTALIDEATSHTEPGVVSRTRHSIALFRSRSATEESKKSAIVALAGILEKRRRLIKAHMLTGDESALFQIANKFDLRHRDEGQQADYDPVFLDWIFWWYLATIELTNRIITRQEADQQEETG